MSQALKKITAQSPAEVCCSSALQLIALDGLEVGITDLPGVTYVFVRSLNKTPGLIGETRITDLALNLCESMVIEPYRTVFVELCPAGNQQPLVLNIEWLDDFPIHITSVEITNRAHANFLETLVAHTNLKPFYLSH